MTGEGRPSSRPAARRTRCQAVKCSRVGRPGWTCCTYSAAALPVRRPKTQMSRRLLPIRRLRPWIPPAASPATYKPGTPVLPSGGGLGIAVSERENEPPAPHVQDLRAETAHFFSHQLAEDLFWIGRASRVVLHGIDESQLCASPVGQHQAIARSAIMVGGRKALVMQPTAATSGDNYGLRQDGHQTPAVQIF